MGVLNKCRFDESDIDQSRTDNSVAVRFDEAGTGLKRGGSRRPSCSATVA